MSQGLPLKSTATSSALFWMGVDLIGVFSASVLTGIFPIGLLLPAWQVRVSSLILAVAPFAGIGAILILLAQLIDPDSDELEEWVARLRLWAIPAAIGFFLLVPLQTYNGYKLLRIASGEERQAIVQLQRTLDAIQSAQNETQLRAAVTQIPGSPPNLGTMKIPLPQVKQRISERLSGQIKKLDNEADERNASRWQANIIGWARSCLLSLCYGAGFAEIAHFPKSRNSLLFSILSSLPWNRRMRAQQLRYQRGLSSECGSSVRTDRNS
jgi:hypothetical protein